MQRYFEYYALGKEERRIGTALGILAALFALLIVASIFMVQRSVEAERAGEIQREVEQTAQEVPGGRIVASQW